MSDADAPTVGERARFRRVVAGLGFTQVIAWGCVYYPVSVTGPQIARDLGLSQGAVFGAYSSLLIASAVVAPSVGRAIDRHGGRPVLAIGCIVATFALLATAGAGSILTYVLCSLLMGIAAAMTLYDAAFPAIVAATQSQGRRAITLVTFAGGFASTVFWPITAALVEHGGWRMTYVIYAAEMLLVCMPANWFALGPVRAKPSGDTIAAPALPKTADPPHAALQGDARRRALMLLGATIAANQIVAAAFLIHIIDFSQKIGIGTREAIVLGMLFGPAQVLGRVGEMLVGGRFSAIMTGRVAAACLPLSLLCVLPASSDMTAAVIFVLLLGLSNGLMTIARGTVALALFGPVGFGATMGRLTVPTLIARAGGPFLFALAIEQFGVRPTILLGLAVAIVACIGMEVLAGIERTIRQAPNAPNL